MESASTRTRLEVLKSSRILRDSDKRVRTIVKTVKTAHVVLLQSPSVRNSLLSAKGPTAQLTRPVQHGGDKGK